MTTANLDAAVQAAKAAFLTWIGTTLKERVQVFFRYKILLEKNLNEVALLVQEENDETYDDAVAEI